MEIKRRTDNTARTTKKQFGRIGVLMGGASSEREISLKSGQAVFGALKGAGLEVCAVDIKTEDVGENARLIKSYRIDCAFLALHGRFGEDGQIQQILEQLSIPYTGSGVEASRLAMDKIASRQIFQGHNLNVPRHKVLERDSSVADEEISNGLEFPLVIKPTTQGSSIGLSIIDRRDDLSEGMDLAFRYDRRILIEEYIKGREVTVGILDERPLPIIEIIPKARFFNYTAKYQPGMTDYVVPASLEEEVAKKISASALSAHKLLGCFGCSRVDMILGDNNLPYVLEVNTIPGLTEASLLPKAARSAGIEFPNLCIKLIELAYAKSKG